MLVSVRLGSLCEISCSGLVCTVRAESLSAVVIVVPCLSVAEVRSHFHAEGLASPIPLVEFYQERHRKKSPPQSTTSQPAAGSHGSLFLWTSLDFHTVNILSLRARGELWRRSKFAQIR